MTHQPRPAQARILEYQRGWMGVSAVPGSGKTWTLSLLAAQIIQQGLIEEDQEVLVVTLVNSAVNNFSQRIRSFLKEFGLLPGIGYRVRTLHGLSRDIISERPDLVALSDKFEIVDNLTANKLMLDVATTWLRNHPDSLDRYFLEGLDESKRASIRRKPLVEYAQAIGTAFIKQAKDMQLDPAKVFEQLERFPGPLPLVEMGAMMYHDYQRALTYRGGVDFDDLIRKAAQAIEWDPDLLKRLQNRFPYILEDEAQDSSRLQELILQSLAEDGGNWVRVGDPNQAIYETFTTANPVYLRNFLQKPGVRAETLPNSGRSSRSIIKLANRLIEWVETSHPLPELRDALAPPYIEPAPENDPQPNPPDAPKQVYLVDTPFSPDDEVNTVVKSALRWVQDHPAETVAILVPRNDRGFKVSKLLKDKGHKPVEMLQSVLETRQAAGALGNILLYLSDPKSSRKLATTFEVWRRHEREDSAANRQLEATLRLLRSCKQIETYLTPSPGEDWLLSVQEEITPEVAERLAEFRDLARRWLDAAVLPIDQLILTIAQDVFREPSELALAYKIATLLKRTREMNPDWRLSEMTQELAQIAKNERRFLGFSDDETGFDPDRYPGRIVVSTMHRAKGLEWDRVYLMSVNNYDFPTMPYDAYLSEKWYVRDKLDLISEALAQLEVACSTDPEAWYEEGTATEAARLSYAAERVRLFYVGITRARKELVVTWNTGRRGEQTQSIPAAALTSYWAAFLASLPGGEEED